MNPHPLYQRLGWLALIGGVTGMVSLEARPYHDGWLKWGMPLSLGLIWLGTLVLLWRWKTPRRIALAFPILAVLPFCLPGRELPHRELRDRYLKALSNMKGSPYLWGGESPRGIDCSGLPRLALRDALLKVGWEHANGAAFRAWASQWWFDTSARAMAEGYQDFTEPVGISGRLRDLDTSRLEPGDLAVTNGRQHVMVYAGDDRWIQADPKAGRVTMDHATRDHNPWFISPVTIHRWKILD